MALQPLIDAIMENRITGTQRMIRSGVPVDASIKNSNKQQSTLLGWAVSFGRKPLVISLLEDGADPSLRVDLNLPGGGNFSGPVLPLSFLLGYANIFHALSSYDGASIDAVFERSQFHGCSFKGTLLLHQMHHGNLIKVLILLGKGPKFGSGTGTGRGNYR